MSPLLTFLFPRLSPQGEARKQIAVNMIANILGLGWAATPAGIKAMELSLIHICRYAFDDQGRMLFGWIDENGEMLTDEDAWKSGLYYCSDNGDGRMATGWKYITAENDEDTAVSYTLLDVYKRQKEDSPSI